MPFLKKYLLNPIRGVFNLILITLTTLSLPIFILSIALVINLIPIKKFKQRGMRFLQRFPIYWIDVVSATVNLTSKKKWEIVGPSNLNPKKSYLLISNHVCWMDIFVLSTVFHRKTPPLKFFLKKQLLWTLPLAGLATWVLGYPFMERHSPSQLRKHPELKGKDIETTRQACQIIKHYPCTLTNYAEGTRFTEEKRIRKSSPYRHLLPPKAGGLATVLEELHTDLAGIINATIVYKPGPLSLWQFCTGNFDKIICHYELIPIDKSALGDYHNDRDARIKFQAWLNRLWRTKDELIDQIKAAS